jgi:hypothetical protein
LPGNQDFRTCYYIIGYKRKKKQEKNSPAHGSICGVWGQTSPPTYRAAL